MFPRLVLDFVVSVVLVLLTVSLRYVATMFVVLDGRIAVLRKRFLPSKVAIA